MSPLIQRLLTLSFIALGVFSSPVSAADMPLLEAEDATLIQAGVVSNLYTYTGSGWVNFQALSGSSITWSSINVSNDGHYWLKFRYGLQGEATSSRHLQLDVDGVTVNPSLSFPGTNTWDNWLYLTVSLPLSQGAHSIKLTTTGEDGPNLDHLLLIENGDNDEDGDIDFLDLFSWTVAPSDINQDGVLNLFDGNYFFSRLTAIFYPTPTLTPTPMPPPELKAFPEAQGFGQDSIGGRGGRVIEVTNLSDSGPGSFRAALEASGPRIVVFKVSGTININDNNVVDSTHSDEYIKITNPYLTIAGQTAPGDGITIKGGSLDISANHVIVRYLRFRPGSHVVDPGNADSIRIQSNATHVIIDHCSLSWSTDGLLDVTVNANNVTAQYNLLSEALDYANHPDSGESHSRASAIGNKVQRISFHHNVYAHNRERHPEATALSQSSSGLLSLEWINNLFYNYDWAGIFHADNADYTVHDDVLRADIIGNQYLWGPNSADHVPYPGRRPVVVKNNFGSVFLFLQNNLSPYKTTLSQPETNNFYADNYAGNYTLLSQRVFSDSTIAIENPTTLRSSLLNQVGTLKPQRDAVDQRIIAEITAGSGHIIDAPSQSYCQVRTATHACIYLTPSDYTQYDISAAEIGSDGWPVLHSALAPEDTDHDGMPNSWEITQGLNPNQAADGAQDQDSDGYTNVEEYLNSL